MSSIKTLSRGAMGNAAEGDAVSFRGNACTLPATVMRKGDKVGQVSRHFTNGLQPCPGPGYNWSVTQGDGPYDPISFFVPDCVHINIRTSRHLIKVMLTPHLEMSEPLTIKFENKKSRLELEFTPGEERTFNSVARIHQGQLDLSFSFCCFGYDLAEFATDLLAFHSRYDGTARLDTQYGDAELEFSFVDSVRGVVGITATFSQWIAWSTDCPTVMHEPKKRSLVFTGFTIEQSYLRAVVSRIREFLSESGISTIHPMIHETSA